MAADTEALAHYHRAMEAYTRARGDEWEPIERAQVERKIGEALARQGEHKAARNYLESSLSYLGTPVPRSRWGTRLTLVRALLTQASHRLLPRKFKPLKEGKPDPVAEEIFLTSQALGFVELTANAERYLLLALIALNTSEKAGYAYGSAYLASSLGLAAALIGLLKLSDVYFHLSASYAEQIDPYRPVFQLEFGLAAKYNMFGDWNRSLNHATQGAEIAQKAGDLRNWGQVMTLVGFSYWAWGKYKEAIDASRQTLQFSEESSDRQVTSSALLLLGTSQRRIGLVEESIRSFQRTLKITKELPDYVRHVGASGWLGRSYLAQGNVAQALITMEAGQELFDAEGGNLPGYAYLGNGLAEAYLTRAEELEGHERRAWLKKARSAFQMTIKKTRGRHTLPETYLFRGRYEWLREKPESAQKWWVRALKLAEDMGMRYEEAMIHFEIGQRLGDFVQLQNAESILEEIGAEFDLAKARESLAILTENRLGNN
jgi:tetratricopeptide (TPR) repeat protein